MAKYDKAQLVSPGNIQQYADMHAAFARFAALKRKDPIGTFCQVLVPYTMEGYDPMDEAGLPGWTTATLRADKYGNIGKWQDVLNKRGGATTDFQNAIFYVGTKSTVITSDGKKNRRIPNVPVPSLDYAHTLLTHAQAGGAKLTAGAFNSQYIVAKPGKLRRVAFTIGYDGQTYKPSEMPTTGIEFEVMLTRRVQFNQAYSDSARVRRYLSLHPETWKNNRQLYDIFHEIPQSSLRRLKNQYLKEINNNYIAVDGPNGTIQLVPIPK